MGTLGLKYDKLANILEYMTKICIEKADLSFHGSMFFAIDNTYKRPDFKTMEMLIYNLLNYCLNYQIVLIQLNVARNLI